MAAKIFTGLGAAVKQVDHVTPANVEADDVFTVTLENHAGEHSSISYTALADTVKDVVEGLKAAALAAHAAGTTPWDEVDATEDDTKLILTATVAGTPFWATSAAANHAGGADTQTLTRTVGVDVAGPSIVRDPNNWGGTLYVAGDDLFFPAATPELLYGEDTTGIVINSCTFEEGFAKAVGSSAHRLKMTFQAKTLKTLVSYGTAQMFLDVNYAAAVTVRNAGYSAVEGQYGLDIVGLNNTTLYVQPASDAGSIGVAARAGLAAAFDAIHWTAGTGKIGAGTTAADTTPVEVLRVTGGSVICEATVDAPYNEAPGGNLSYRGGAVTGLEAWAGTTLWDTGAGGTSLKNSGGAVDFRPNRAAKTFGTVYLYKGFNVSDPYRVVTATNGWQFPGCSEKDGVLDFGVNYKITPASI